jgi:polar amino acid transport system substrate-binding protein
MAPLHKHSISPHLVLTFFTVLCIFIISGCSSNGGNDSTTKITSLDELNGKTIGSPAGSTYDIGAKEYLPDSEILYYNTNADCITAVSKGLISAYLIDLPIALYQMASNPSLYYIDATLSKDDYGFVLSKSNTELCSEMNTVIAEMWADGTIDELQNKWMKLEGDDYTITKDPNADTSKGTLRVITDATQEPFAMFKDDEIIGYDAELITRIGEKLGYDVVIENADFTALLSAVMTGKSDVAIGCITITEERAQSVLFTDPVYYGGTVLVLYDDESTQDDGFWVSIKNSFMKTFITENRWQLILSGIAVTAEMVIASIIFGSIIGFFFSFMLRSKNKAVLGIGNFISTIFNGMPILLVLMIFYYIIFNKSSLSSVAVGIFAFSLEFANTVAGLLNTGILAVDKGELEAAESLGYSKWQVFLKITFPQAAKQMSSQYNGAIIGLIKGTSVVGYITAQDLTKVGDLIRSRTYEAFFPLIAVAIIYFIFEYIIIVIIKKFEIQLDPKRRPRKLKGIDIND